jgi:hypothetical protein
MQKNGTNVAFFPLAFGIMDVHVDEEITKVVVREMQ